MDFLITLIMDLPFSPLENREEVLEDARMYSYEELVLKLFRLEKKLPEIRLCQACVTEFEHGISNLEGVRYHKALQEQAFEVYQNCWRLGVQQCYGFRSLRSF